jgi:hypothetical protein
MEVTRSAEGDCESSQGSGVRRGATSRFSTKNRIDSEVVPLHFEVRDSAVPLRGFDPAVAQKILDGDQVCIGIK